MSKHTKHLRVEKDGRVLRVSLFADSPGDVHLGGDIVVELSADGIRWWYDTGDDAHRGTVHHLTANDLVAHWFQGEKIDLDDDVHHARLYIERVAKRVEALRRLMSFKTIGWPDELEDSSTPLPPEGRARE